MREDQTEISEITPLPMLIKTENQQCQGNGRDECHLEGSKGSRGGGPHYVIT